MKKLLDILLIRNYIRDVDADDLLRRQKLILFQIFSVVAFFICLMNTSILALQYQVPVWPVVMAISGLVIFVNLIVLPYHKKEIQAYWVVLFTTSMLLHSATYVSGGIRNASLMMFAAIVLLAFMLLGSKKAIWFTVFIVANIIYFYAITPLTEQEITNGTGLITNVVPDEEHNNDILVSYILGFLFISSLANYLESKKNVVIEKITESRDILAEKNKELSKLSMVASKAENGIVITDSQGNIEWLNDGLTRLLGFTLDDVKGKKPFEAFHGEKTSVDEVLKLRTAIDNKESFNGEFEKRKKDGSYTWVALTVTPIVEEGEDTKFIFIESDINARKAAEAKTQEYTKNLESAFKELDKFAYVVSHDLKAPLRAIFNLTSWIEEDHGHEFSPEAKDLFNRVRGRVLRMEGLIEGILAYSKIDRKDDVVVDIDLNELVKDSLELLDLPKNMTINFAPNMPVLKGDKAKVNQLFMNLLSNAIKFNDKEQGLINVGCEDTGTDWKFSVADNGPGIDKQYHDKIFVIFQTLNARDDFESTGVGLAIVKKIIDELGGKIWVESEVGQGATFNFTIPKNATIKRKTFMVAA